MCTSCTVVVKCGGDIPRRQPGIWPVVKPKDRCHVINDGTNYTFSQVIIRNVRESGLLHGLGKSAEDGCPAPWFGEFLEIWVTVVLEFIEEHDPSFPRYIPLILYLTSRVLFTGRLTSKAETHDTISDGSSTILKLFGICE